MAPRERGISAQVEVHDLPPVGAQGAEVFLAQHEGEMVTSVDEVQGEGGAVKTEHTRPGTMIMYKPTERHGYVPRRVSVSALRLLIRQGWKEFCPDCNSRHLDKNGEDSTDPNLCKARDPVAVRVCPVCGKRIYDNVGVVGDVIEENDGDVNVIRDTAYDNSTGASRTLQSLNLHLWVFHRQEAMRLNTPPLPAAMRDMLPEESRA